MVYMLWRMSQRAQPSPGASHPHWWPHFLGEPIKTNLRAASFIAAMLRHVQFEQQVAFITEKLSMPTMDVGQRVYWHSAGVLVSPETFTTVPNGILARARSVSTIFLL